MVSTKTLLAPDTLSGVPPAKLIGSITQKNVNAEPQRTQRGNSENLENDSILTISLSVLAPRLKVSGFQVLVRPFATLSPR